MFAKRKHGRRLRTFTDRGAGGGTSSGTAERDERRWPGPAGTGEHTQTGATGAGKRSLTGSTGGDTEEPGGEA